MKYIVKDLSWDCIQRLGLPVMQDLGEALPILKMVLCPIQLLITKGHLGIPVNIVLKSRMPFKWHNGELII